MSLQDEIKAFNDKNLANIPAETRDIMTEATRELASSGLTERALSEGDILPPFTLPDCRSRSVSSRHLLAAGPLVVSFFRGNW